LAARLTPAIRSSNPTKTSGAHSISVDIPAGTTWALIGFCYYNDTGPKATTDPTSVSLDGQSAGSPINSAGSTSTVYTALYKVSGTSTGSSKTLAYTLSATGTYSALAIAVEFESGTPTYGANGANNTTGSPGTATTSSLGNSNGDLILSAYCVGSANGAPTAGSGQTKLDDTNDAVGSTYYGFTTETATGAGDAQAITGQIPSITSTVVTVVTTPTYTSSPTYAKVDNNTVRATFTCNGSSATARGGLYVAGASTPTAAQVAAGTNAHGTASTICTGSSQTLDIDASDSPAFPKYDPYVILDISGSYSTVPTTSTVTLDPPTTCGANADQACQYVTLTSVAIGGIAAVATLAYDGQTANFAVGETVTGGTSGAVALIQADTDAGATGTLTLWVSSGTFQNDETLTGNVNGVAVVNGTATYLYAVNDVLVAPTYVSPGGSGVALTIGVDGNASYTSGSERETALNIKVYDYSVGAYASGDIDFVNNDSAPTCPGFTVESVLLLNSAMSSFDLDNSCTDVEADTLNSAEIGTLPTGITLNGTTNVTSGTPTVENESGVTIKYLVYDIYGALGSKTVIYYPVASWTVTPNCASTPTTFASCTASINSLTHNSVTVAATYAHSALVAVGNVISMSPAAGAQLAPGGTETLTISSGASSTHVPNCLAKTATQCRVLLGEASIYATLSTSCAANDAIYSQAPAANSKAAPISR
jgi:hypothetical protein